MERVPERELMLDEETARMFLEVDFSSAHEGFVSLFRERFAGWEARGHVLDLGCGSGEISLRFARAYPGCIVHGVDGSPAMLRCGEEFLARDPDARRRVELVAGLLPGAILPRPRYEAVISNSLLHHLHDPQALWSTVRRHAAPGAPVFVMDLRRPATVAEARRIRDEYTSRMDGNRIVYREIYSSLLAAFETGEIAAQLAAAGLGHLAVEKVDEIHLAVTGIMLMRQEKR